LLVLPSQLTLKAKLFNLNHSFELVALAHLMTVSGRVNFGFEDLFFIRKINELAKLHRHPEGMPLKATNVASVANFL
jgi:hypothetical protein